MNLLYFMIPMALLLGLGFLIAFIWAVRSGQYDDLEGPAHQILIDDSKTQKKKEAQDELK